MQRSIFRPLFSLGFAAVLGAGCSTTQMGQNATGDAGASAAAVSDIPSERYIENLRARAEAGNAAAQEELAEHYVEGKGVPEDYSEAYFWFHLAAEKGRSGAEKNLIGLTKYMTLQELETGNRKLARLNPEAQPEVVATAAVEIPKSHSTPNEPVLSTDLPIPNTMSVITPYQQEALNQCRQAAERGDAKAQHALGLIYESGKDGLPRDPIEAYKWFLLAAVQDLPEANLARRRIVSTLSGAEIAEGKRRAATVATQSLTAK